VKVGELARLAGVTAETVRYYARVGLLRPATDDSNGYRRFNSADLERLRFILRAKQLGFQIGEISQILGLADGGQAPCRVVREIVERRIGDTRRQLAEMQALQARLENAVTLWATVPNGEPDGHAVCALIEAVGDAPDR
jgi:DNA-binding transcriptional MerR regulator